MTGRVHCLLAGLLAALACAIAATPCQAEYRKWTASTGGYTTEAEFIELRDGKTVRLQLKDGSVRDIPLDKLIAADQDYVRQKIAGGKNTRLAKVQQAADRCRSAEDALRVYRVFHFDPQTTDEERRAIAARLEELQGLAAKKMLKVAGKWVTEEECKQRRQQANTLMKQGLELLRLKQEDGFRQRFADAAALEPDSVRAEFMLSMYYATNNRDLTKAQQYLESCLHRDSTNVAVLNNLAVIEVKRNQLLEALAHWRKATAGIPHQAIVHNLGRAVSLAGQKQLTMNKSMLGGYSDLYVTQLAKEKITPASESFGWLYMLIDEELLNLDPEPNEAARAVDPIPPPDGEGLRVVGSGTGFVVHSNYIVTNAHVVNAGTAYEIQTSEGTKDTTMRATLVAKSEKPDLALLKCELLMAAPLAVDPAVCGRGTDIMTFGYPQTGLLGASLKATRGVISALPSPAVDDMYLYDAVVNPGNSGGPVCNARGNVVAVETVGITTKGQYGGGIPAAALVEFLQKNLPGFAAAPLGQDALDWPAVDKKVGPSTVLIWVRKKVGDGEAVASPGMKLVEDISCTPCSHLHTPSPRCLVCSGSGVDSDLVSRKVALAKAEAPDVAAPQRPRVGNKPPRAEGVKGPERDDTNQHFPHRPLDEATSRAIRVAIVGKRAADTPQIGGGKTPFRDMIDRGGLLIGFDFGFGEFVRKPTITGVRPTYLTAQGNATGNWFGAESIAPIVHVEARPGYAVGGLRIKAGLGTDNITVIFMRVRNNQLDPTDAYESAGYGGTGGFTPREVGMDGSFVIGIHGKVSDNTNMDGLGLITVSP